jgi:N-acetylmuramoyl-L-alanine amidase
MEHITPSVGLMTLAGCLTFLIAPNDEDPGTDPRIAAMLNPNLPTIVIDAGHGGRDNGAKANGLVEKELTLDMAFRVEKQLQMNGYRTFLTRKDDTFVSLPDRSSLANRFDHSIFVSIHFNNSISTSASGLETFYASSKVAPEPEWSWAAFLARREPLESLDTGENLAGYIQTALVTKTEATNRGAKSQPFYVIRHTRAPAVLVEGGFLSNPFEARLIATPEYRERLASAVVEGVVQFANTMPKPGRPATQFAKASR